MWRSCTVFLCLLFAKSGAKPLEDANAKGQAGVGNDWKNADPDRPYVSGMYGDLFQGDIILPKTRNGITQEHRKWPGGVVPYVIDSSVGSRGRQVLPKAFQFYHSHTCIQFKARTTEKTYLVIKSPASGSCSSGVGMGRGAQALNLGTGCFGSLGTPLHEFMHALGFHHEQTREDRDSYVTIHWENIEDRWEYNFKIFKGSTTFGTKYDYGSVMHYEARAFSTNGKYTIVPKNGVDPKSLGNGQRLTDTDIYKVNQMYNCKNTKGCSLAGSVTGYTGQCGDCPGNDLWHLSGSVASPQECAKRCDGEPKCKGFLLYGQHCSPKSATCTTPTTVNPKNAFYTRKSTDCVLPPVLGYTAECGDCPGNDIESLYGKNVGLEECANRCAKSPLCRGFMLDNGKDCYPKSATCNNPFDVDIQKKVFYKPASKFTDHACEQKQLQIACRSPAFIKVTRANYGREDDDTCPGPVMSTTCVAPKSLQIVRSRCDGKSSCSVPASNGLFGDNCAGTSKYLKVDYECHVKETDVSSAHACESKTLQLACRSPAVIKVTRANYGRLDRTTCPGSVTSTSCVAPITLQVVRGMCEGKASCSVPASNGLFGDFCHGTQKYLEVDYKCA